MINWLVQTFGWMYWTLPSALFMIGVFGSIIFLSILGVYRPNVDRKGFLPIETGRGDRLFIAVYSSIVFFLFWLGIFGDNFLVVAVIILVLWFFSVFKWG
ncbi:MULTISPECIES: DUF2160 domain-containing protein [unclassified Oceanispirochaeta]|uniref:DUF2160 domain-containing protein n=1 Tax=unclassified Oceanispirochaeta TaxID=2635722 RepID=UPI000E092A61|nr:MULTISPECIES: DUF2160 family membrane protein [unclassified Oceanispirochaeta]MBF9018414.1 hypothetical protein [Oceanispirochaeta sp. M2]NPD74845.1 hypothetical protein [Oceanispirochaeta sp. M1]RDG29287.1 hypothetical protein DV872_22365 [Oceanispirochaeta sp. M1]